jgi:hypothetical protein
VPPIHTQHALALVQCGCIGPFLSTFFQNASIGLTCLGRLYGTKRIDLTPSSFFDMSKFQSALYTLSIYPQTGRNAPYAQLFFSVEANNFFRGNSHRNSPMYRVPSHGVKGIFVRVLPVSLVGLPDSRSHLAEKRQAYAPAVLFDLCDLTVLCVSSENPNG